MAKLSRFRQDSAAINAGEWVALGEEWDNLEIRTRGFTDAYGDMQSAKLRREAQKHAGDVNRIPQAIKREISVDCLIAEVLMDVRNLTDDAGNPVSFDAFCGLLRDPDYMELVVACFRAASMVGQRRQIEVDDAVGPLAQPSGSIWSGDNSATS